MVKTIRELKETKVVNDTPDFESKDWTGKNGGYFSIPNSTIEAIAMKGLTATEMLVYLYMIRMVHNNNGSRFIHSYGNMAKKLNRGVKSVQNAVKKLEELKLIHRTKRGGIFNMEHKANEYKVNYVVLEDQIVPTIPDRVFKKMDNKKKSGNNQEFRW